MKDFMSSKLNLFEGIELTVQTLVCASVKVSVESVVESMVSRYENHFHKSRGLDELNALGEMEIAENGPSDFKADNLLMKAMDKYWKTETKSGMWHFSCQSSPSQNVINFGPSLGKSSMNIINTPSKYPMMDL